MSKEPRPHIEATAKLGEHLLGRIPSPPDARDYRVKDYLPAVKLHEEGDMNALADMTVRQIITQTSYFTSWKGILVFWRWLKQWIKANVVDPTPNPPLPDPTPTPTPTPIPPDPTRNTPWMDASVLDQGQTGHCVGFGSTGLEDSYPNPHDYDNAWAHDFYYFIKTAVDRVARTDPAVEDGTYVRSAGKALALKGKIGAYAFAGTVGEIVKWVQTKGPVVMGTDWSGSMFDPDTNGFVRFDPNDVQGGHCYLLLGYDANTQVFTFLNSWGTSWAKGGYFFMHRADFELLFSQSGTEAMVALDLAT